MFALENIHPKYRSILHAIQLVLAVTCPVIEKYGLDIILKPFIDDLKVLANDGIAASIGGEEKIFHGALLVFLAENFASHSLGGFKESSSFAMCICRTCMITSSYYKGQYDISSITLRSTGSHEAQCSQLNGDLHDHYSNPGGKDRERSQVTVQ